MFCDNKSSVALAAAARALTFPDCTSLLAAQLRRRITGRVCGEKKIKTGIHPTLHTEVDHR